MKKLLLAILVGCMLTLPVAAEENMTDTILNDVLREAKEIQTPGFNLAETTQKAAEGRLELNPEAVLHHVMNLIFGELKANAATMIKMLVLAVLAGILVNLQENMPNDGMTEISFLACFALIAGLSVGIISGLLGTAEETVDTLTVCMAGLMPVMGSMAVSSAAAALSGFYPALFVAMQSFVSICKNVFLPLIMVITALSVVNALSGRFQIGRLIDLARQIIKWGLGLLLTVFVGILTIHCFTAGAAGTVAGRTVKYALCSFIPMVGGVLAESAEAVMASLHILRGALGISGMIAIISMCALPLIKILAASVLYRFAAAMAEPATDHRIVQLLIDLAGNMTLIFVILLMVAVMFIISIALLCMVLA